MLKYASKSAYVLQIGWRSAPETAAIVIGEEIAATICGYARSLRLKPQLDASAEHQQFPRLSNSVSRAHRR